MSRTLIRPVHFTVNNCFYFFFKYVKTLNFVCSFLKFNIYFFKTHVFICSRSFHHQHISLLCNAHNACSHHGAGGYWHGKYIAGYWNEDAIDYYNLSYCFSLPRFDVIVTWAGSQPLRLPLILLMIPPFFLQVKMFSLLLWFKFKTRIQTVFFASVTWILENWGRCECIRIFPASSEN